MFIHVNINYLLIHVILIHVGENWTQGGQSFVDGLEQVCGRLRFHKSADFQLLFVDTNDAFVRLAQSSWWEMANRSDAYIFGKHHRDHVFHVALLTFALLELHIYRYSIL